MALVFLPALGSVVPGSDLVSMNLAGFLYALFSARQGGVMENTRDTLFMVYHSRGLLMLLAVYMCAHFPLTGISAIFMFRISIAFFNFCGVYITSTLSAVHR